MERREGIHLGLTVFVGKGLVPFRNMVNRNGARPFPTIICHNQAEQREDIHLGLIPFVGKGLVPFRNLAKWNGSRPFPTTTIRHNQMERRKAVPYNNHLPQPNGTAQDRSLQ